MASRKHYRAVAEAIKLESDRLRKTLATGSGEMSAQDALAAVKDIAKAVGGAFASDNDAFRMTTFLDACGFGD